MEDLKPIVAKNISDLRLANNMTQFELAEKLNYDGEYLFYGKLDGNFIMRQFVYLCTA